VEFSWAGILVQEDFSDERIIGKTYPPMDRSYISLDGLDVDILAVVGRGTVAFSGKRQVFAGGSFLEKGLVLSIMDRS
jgi:hypothetical protein